MVLRYLIHRPVGVILSFALFVLLGIYLSPRIPVSLLPETDVPYLSIHIHYPSGNAEAIEAEITKPVRLQMLQVHGITDVWSSTENGRAELELRFGYGRNMSLAYIEANEKLDQILSRLPRDLDRPLVQYNSLSDLPVLYVSVCPKEPDRVDFVDFGQFSRNIIKRRIEQLEPVAFVDITGYDQSEIRIIPDLSMMEALDVDEADLARAIRENNISLGSITLKEGQYQYNVHFKAHLSTVDDIRHILIQKADRLIPLRDIAQVEMAARDPRGKYFAGKERGILMSVLKQPRANIFALQTDIENSLEVLREEYPEIEINTTLDQSRIIRTSLDNLRSSLIWGAVFAILILFVFYRKFSAIFLMALVIPATLISSLLLYYLIGLSVNVISLAGLILGVGLMIDNSIIIIENITQYRQQGQSMMESSIRGANEVFTPLLTSFLTTCSVFIPLLFMSGIAGALFYEQAVSISISLLMSLLIAFMIIPVLIELFGFDFALKKEEHFLERWHHYLLDFALRFPWMVVLIFGMVLAVAVLIWGRMKKEAFPPVSREGVEFFIDWNQNITPEENEFRSQQLIEIISSLSEETHLLLGEQQFLLDRREQNIRKSRLICLQSDPEKQIELTEAVSSFCQKNYPFTLLEHRFLQNSFDVIFDTDPNGLYIQLRPMDPQNPPDIHSLTEKIEILRHSGFQIDLPNQTENLVLTLDLEKSMAYKIPVEVVERRLEALLDHYRLGEMTAGQGKIEINIHQNKNEYSPSFHSTSSSGESQPEPVRYFGQILQSVLVKNSAGDRVSLDKIIRIDYESGFREIKATQLGESFIFPVAKISDPEYVKLKDVLNTLDEYTYHLSGSYFEQKERLRELSWVLGVTFLLLFLILSAEFESIKLPFVILLTMPFGMAGAILLLYIGGQSISVLSMIGVVVMAGIMVNDAILKLDMIIRLREKIGEKAALYEAGKRRIKPIIMTSLTTILALVPVLFSSGLGPELQTPLALAVIGGVSVGTLTSILLVPLIYLAIRPRKTVN